MKILLKLSSQHLFLALVISLLSDYSFSQTSTETPLTVEIVNQKIGAIQTKIESVNYRIGQLQSSPSLSQSDVNYIDRLQESKLELTKELEKLEKIKTSVEYAEQNQLIEKKNQGGPVEHSYTPTQKVKLTQSEFNALPEIKKQSVLDHPEQYEIIN